ncbi:hypothetical protein [Bradyrhizobium oligotrophicum]|uniref:hypothetical protein n=1 Tax=Bradyrhizobium oligotrophicum TaxID=44255 RepID=UPI003EC072EA
MAEAKTRAKAAKGQIAKAARVPPRLVDDRETKEVLPITTFVGPNDSNPFGGASKEELASVVQNNLGDDPDFEAPEGALAVELLARSIAARMSHADWVKDTKRLAVFIVSDRAREMATALGAAREPIIDNGSRCLTGALWLTGGSFASGYYLKFNSCEPSEIFDEVRAKGLGSKPALAFDPNATKPEIRFYPKGVDDEARVQRFIVSSGAFTLAALDSVMKNHYEQSIITPDATLPDFNPWKNAAKYYPRERAEAFFQGMLKLVLDVAFGPKCRIAFEVRGTEGRCDLLISSRAGQGDWLNHAALELKVLRSFTSGGSAVSSAARVRAVRNGLLQAVAYRNENDAKNGLLCCFDMRAPKHCDGASYLKPISAKAKQQKIGLRSFRIFASSEDLRQHKYG